jgi:hypothetical protein
MHLCILQHFSTNLRFLIALLNLPGMDKILIYTFDDVPTNSFVIYLIREHKFEGLN